MTEFLVRSFSGTKEETALEIQKWLNDTRMPGFGIKISGISDNCSIIIVERWKLRDSNSLMSIVTRPKPTTIDEMPEDPSVDISD